MKKLCTTLVIAILCYCSYAQTNTFPQSGNVGIGTTTPDAALAVNGTIHTKEVKVDLTGWSDYVFEPAYKLPKLNELKEYLDKNHHLPEITISLSNG